LKNKFLISTKRFFDRLPHRRTDQKDEAGPTFGSRATERFFDRSADAEVYHKMLKRQATLFKSGSYSLTITKQIKYFLTNKIFIHGNL